MLRKEQPLGGNLASAVVEFVAGCVTPSNACLCFGRQKENHDLRIADWMASTAGRQKKEKI